MPDLPDYYTQAAIAEAEAAAFNGGLAANRPDDPVSRDIYLGTDNQVLYVCFTDGEWTGFNAAMLTKGILTLYENMAGGGKRITNIADPTAAQDAATGAYVLARVALEATARNNAIGAEATARANADALRLLLAGGTMSGNIAMGTKKLTGLGAPTAQDNSLRYGRAEIRNAEIAAAAAIVYTKLNLTGALKKGDIEAAAGIEYSKLALAASIVMADFAAAIQNAANGIVVLDASADVPLAQIPDTLTGKDADTLDGSHLIDLYPELIAEVFRLLTATGDMNSPDRLNDDNTGSYTYTSTINKYAEAMLIVPYKITQFRQFGTTDNGVGDGRWKIQYLDLDDAWQDWVTAIPTRRTADWGNWDSSGGEVIAKAIKLICTTVESAGNTCLAELQVKY